MKMGSFQTLVLVTIYVLLVSTGQSQCRFLHNNSKENVEMNANKLEPTNDTKGLKNFDDQISHPGQTTKTIAYDFHRPPTESNQNVDTNSTDNSKHRMPFDSSTIGADMIAKESIDSISTSSNAAEPNTASSNDIVLMAALKGGNSLYPPELLYDGGNGLTGSGVRSLINNVEPSVEEETLLEEEKIIEDEKVLLEDEKALLDEEKTLLNELPNTGMHHHPSIYGSSHHHHQHQQHHLPSMYGSTHHLHHLHGYGAGGYENDYRLAEMDPYYGEHLHLHPSLYRQSDSLYGGNGRYYGPSSNCLPMDNYHRQHHYYSDRYDLCKNFINFY